MIGKTNLGPLFLFPGNIVGWSETKFKISWLEKKGTFSRPGTFSSPGTCT